MAKKNNCLDFKIKQIVKNKDVHTVYIFNYSGIIFVIEDMKV